MDPVVVHHHPVDPSDDLRVVAVAVVVHGVRVPMAVAVVAAVVVDAPNASLDHKWPTKRPPICPSICAVDPK